MRGSRWIGARLGVPVLMYYWTWSRAENQLVLDPARRNGTINVTSEAMSLAQGIASVMDGQAMIVVRGDFERASVSPQYLTFDGTNGKLVQVKVRVGPAAETRGVLYALHVGRFADITLRWLYFLVSLAGTAMVGTGLVLWTVKRRAKLPDPERPYFGFRVVERLNIAAVAGLSIAMTAFLRGNRLLPVGIAQRGEWEIHVFFIVWATTLAHAMLRPAKRASLEQLWLGATLLTLLPILNALTTGRGLPASIAAGDWVFAGFDLTLLTLAGLHATLAIRTAWHKPKAKRVRRTALEAAGEAA